MAKVVLFPGWSQSPRHYRTLEAVLDDAHIKLKFFTSPVQKADVVVCQSSGCLNKWEDINAKTFILIAPPYIHRGRFTKLELIRRFNSRARNELLHHLKNKRLAAGLRLTGRSIVKIIKEPRTNHQHINLIKKGAFVNKVQTYAADNSEVSIYIIHYRKDRWTDAGLHKAFTGFPNVTLALRDGPHDDILYNPKPYVQMIKELL